MSKNFIDDNNLIVLDGSDDEEFDDEIILEKNEKDTIRIDNGLNKILKPHQIDGIRFMYKSTIGSLKQLQQTNNNNDDQSINGCILAHSMGLGKTLQVIIFLHSILTNKLINRQIQKVLIVVPYNVAQNWGNEFDKWLKKCVDKTVNIRLWKVHETKSSSSQRQQMFANWDCFGGVLIISSRMISNMIDNNLLNSNEKLYRNSLINTDLVIVDEGHLLKNNKTSFYKSLMMIKTKRRIILTGTPLQNNLIEYYFMVDFIKPKLLGKLDRFKSKFVAPINGGQLIDSSDYEVKLMKKRIHVLTTMLKKYIHRCDYEILIPYLPPKYEYVIGVRMSSLQSRLYRYYINNLTTISRKNLLNDSRILMLINNHPSLLLDYYRKQYGKENIDKHEEFWWKKLFDSFDFVGLNNQNKETITDMKFSSKFIIIFFILKYCQRINDKVLIFSQSLATLNYLELLLNENNWCKNKDYFRIDGKVDLTERHDVIEKFNNKYHCSRLMLISIRAGGIGINLVGANRAILIDCSWNPAIDSQAIFRVFRLGQTKPVYIYRLVSYGTMEWKIYERQVQKQSLSKRVIDEQHIVRNYTRAQLEEMYQFEESPDLIAIPEVPSDNLLADLLLNDNDRSIISYHEHDSLLAQRPEEELDNSEKIEAWHEYLRQSKSDRQSEDAGVVMKKQQLDKNDIIIIDPMNENDQSIINL